MTELIYPEMPEHSLVVLIGPSGAGKSTIARTWPASQVLSLDALREVVSDDFSVKFNVLKLSSPLGRSADDRAAAFDQDHVAPLVECARAYR